MIYLIGGPGCSGKTTLAELESMQQESILLRGQCLQKGYPFFDTSQAYHQVIDQAAQYLINGSRSTD